MSKAWVIGLSGWDLDWGPDDFYVGRSAKFALDFHAKEFEILRDAPKKECERVEDTALYRVTAKVIYATPKAWIIDFGLRAIRLGTPPEGIALGTHVKAEIGLEVDAFDYFAGRLQSSFPPLTYSWDIIGIDVVAVPLVRTGNSFEPDPSRAVLRAVQSTAEVPAGSIESLRPPGLYDGIVNHYVLHTRRRRSPERTRRSLVRPA
jgi:hypothetical protein